MVKGSRDRGVSTSEDVNRSKNDSKKPGNSILLVFLYSTLQILI
jgi:hypothetical protein